VAKALLESLCFELLLNLETLQSGGVRVDELVAVGGGAKSPRWLQLKADVLGRPIRTLRCREAACWGAALLAGAGAGLFPSLEAAVRRTVAFDREYEPRPELTARYRGRFALYPSVAATLRDVHLKL
jgi:xylulokinase